MRTVYIDSCIAIYLVEEHSVYCPSIEAALENCDGIICYSPLTVLECLVLPLRLHHTELLAKFKRFFSLNYKIDIPDAVYRDAAALRAKHGIKIPDALHLATARHHGCSEFWTNDDRLAEVAGGMAVNVANQKI